MADSGRGAVVITGASTGIGAACATYLTGRGFRVFAGVRKAADGEALQKGASGDLIPIVLDVTDSASIRSAAAQVREAMGDNGLAGLVNNAGIAIAGPLEFVPLEDFRRQMEVNVTGAVAVTQAFLPLLRQAKGRIVLMGSVGGRSSLPFIAPYTASKFALEAIADALRVELKPWGMHVAIIEPSAVSTPIWEKSAPADVADRFPAEARRLYGPVLSILHRVSMGSNRRGIPAVKVAQVVEHALTARQPRLRYPVGLDTAIRLMVEAMLPGRLRDALIIRWLPKFGPGK